MQPDIRKDGEGRPFLVSQLPELEFEIIEGGGYSSELGEEGTRVTNGNPTIFRSELLFEDIDVEGYSEFAEEDGYVTIPLSCLRLLTEVEIPDRPDKDKQMEMARDVLDKVRKLDMYSVVAGGAPADWLEERQANDIDVFLCLPAHYNRDDMREALSTALGESVEPMASRPYQSDGDVVEDVFSLWKGMQEIQFIVIASDPRKCTEDFPFTNTCVSWDGEQFHLDEGYKMVRDFKLVVQRKDVKPAYKDKCLAKLEKLGLTLCSSPEEALDKSMEFMLKRKEG